MLNWTETAVIFVSTEMTCWLTVVLYGTVGEVVGPIVGAAEGDDWRVAMESVPLEWPILLAILSKGFVLIEAALSFPPSWRCRNKTKL